MIVIEVALVADDGHHATTPATVRNVALNSRGQVTLDIITETLADEPPSRALLNWRLRSRGVILPSGRARTRQVNANQTVRGVAVEFTEGDEKKTDLVHLIDFANPQHNEFLVINQFIVTGTKQPR
ncbi:MAG: hypothetical protein HYU66_21215, partial [Armatimonadetes bacterium]|nr:hypothetical protein [Armatimonadota bacterium]